MSGGRATTQNFIRLQFDLERDENPRLYDDLARFTKGVKRVNRLRTLAQDGLFVQCLPTGTFPHSEVGGNRQAPSGEDGLPSREKRVGVMNQLFEGPITE